MRLCSLFKGSNLAYHSMVVCSLSRLGGKTSVVEAS